MLRTGHNIFIVNTACYQHRRYTKIQCQADPKVYEKLNDQFPLVPMAVRRDITRSTGELADTCRLLTEITILNINNY